MARGKSIRQITVGMTRYVWVVRRLDESHVILRVWSAERNRRDRPLEVRVRYDDPWLNYGPILTAPPDRREHVFQLVPVTPGMVRETIEAAVAMGWGPDHPVEPRRFERTVDGTLIHDPDGVSSES